MIVTLQEKTKKTAPLSLCKPSTLVFHPVVLFPLHSTVVSFKWRKDECTELNWKTPFLEKKINALGPFAAEIQVIACT